MEDVALNPAQADLLAQLRSTDEDDRTFDAGLRQQLRAELEARIDPFVGSLPKVPLFLNKHTLSQVHGCEVRFLAEDAERGFAWTPALARGTVAHKAIEITLNRRQPATPGEAVDAALDRLADSDAWMADWLRGCCS